jgi:hypothetical protein
MNGLVGIPSHRREGSIKWLQKGIDRRMWNGFIMILFLFLLLCFYCPFVAAVPSCTLLPNRQLLLLMMMMMMQSTDSCTVLGSQGVDHILGIHGAPQGGDHLQEIAGKITVLYVSMFWFSSN